MENIEVYIQKKATLLSRHPDIYSREAYEQWKKEANQFMNDIRHGQKNL